MFVYQSDCVGSDRVVCMCVCSESERGVFPALFLASHGGGERNVEQVRSFPPLQELRSEKKKKLPKSRPQLPSLSASFRRFLITRLRLRSVPRPPSSSPSRGPLFFVYLPPLLAHAIHFDASCLLICLTRVKRQITPPLQCHLPLSSQCFFRSVENQELPQIMLRFNQPCRAFWFFLGPCCSIHPKPLCGGDPRAVLAMFVFSLMYLVTFLRRV